MIIVGLPLSAVRASVEAQSPLAYDPDTGILSWEGDVLFQESGLNVAAGSSVEFDLTDFINRGLCHWLHIEETGGSFADTFDVFIYKKDTFVAGTDNEDLNYSAEGVSDNPFVDAAGFMLTDLDGTSELHIKITNNDAVNAAVFSLTMKCEQFA